jgi:hypothetical protein
VLQDGDRRYCQDEDEVGFVATLLKRSSIRRVQRDAYCLDGFESEPEGRGVIDAEQWLEMPRPEGMQVLGLRDEADYIRAYRSIEDAVLERDRAQTRTGVKASIVVKKHGTPVVDASQVEESA